MSIVKKNFWRSFSKSLDDLKIFFSRNYLKILFTASFLLTLTLISSFIILYYCDIFYEFSNHAKERILNHRYLIFLTTPLFFWASTFLYKKYAFNPYGSGLDNVTFAVTKLQKYPDNYRKVANFIGLKVAVVIFFSSLISTFGGGSLGREAPSILIAVCIFFASAHYLKKYLINMSLEVWIYVGYAVGMAVAFSAPWAGAIYVIEKLLKNSSKNYSRPILFSFLALIIIYFLLANHCAIYFIRNFENLNFVDFYHYSIIAILCSLLAHIMLKICRYFYVNFMKIDNWFWHFIPLLFGLLVAFIGLYYGIFSVGGGIRSVNEALLSDKIIYNFDELIGRYFSTIFTYISGNAGGLVAPSIALGNLVGSVYAALYEGLNSKALMLVGMVAFLSPILGVPITSAMIIVEATKIDFSNFFVLAIVSSISFLIVLIIQKLGSKIRAKLFKPTTN